MSPKSNALCISLIIHIAVGITTIWLSLVPAPSVRFELIRTTAGVSGPVHTPQRVYLPVLILANAVPHQKQPSLTHNVDSEHSATSDDSEDQTRVVPELLSSEPPPGNPDVRPPIIFETQVDPAVPLEQTSATYPELARKARVDGIVTLEGIVNSNGDVEKLRVISGHPMLVDAAIEAVEKWKYRPAKVNGHFVPQTVQVQVRFRLDYPQ